MAWPVQAADTVCVFPPQQCRRRRPTAAGEARWARRGQPAPALRISRPRLRAAAQPGHRRGADHGELQREAQRRDPQAGGDVDLLGQGRRSAHRRAGRRRWRSGSRPIRGPAWRDRRRSVVVAMVQRMGPAPNRKKASAASAGEGRARVSSIRPLASSAHSGPAAISAPKLSRRARRQQRAGQHAQAIDAQRQAHAGGVQLRSRMA